MSDHRALAAASAALEGLLTRAVQAVLPEAAVTHLHPDTAAAEPTAPRVNLHLLGVSPSASLRNLDLPGRNAAGELVQHHVVALDLRFLLTFHGPPEARVPERLLGQVLAALAGTPRLDRERLAGLLAADPTLAASIADARAPAVALTQVPLTLDEGARLWRALSNRPAPVHVVAQAAPVTIAGWEVPDTPPR